jgi:hypothetical protein
MPIKTVGRKKWQGQMLPSGEPVWEPLLEFAPNHIGDFMWMFAVELEDGRRLDAYKHWWTRRYLHLTGTGRVFVFEHRGDLDDPGWYLEANPVWLLQLVLPSGENLVDFHRCVERARQDSNLRPCAPEAHALSN